MSSPRAGSATLAVLLLLTGCCKGLGGGGPGLETGPLALPPASHATAVPAEWFVTADPGDFVESDALLACHEKGETRGIELTYAVLEVGIERITLAGDPVLTLEGGIPRPEDAKGYYLAALYDALDALFDQSSDLATAQCRPWTTGETFLPEALQRADRPPLLLAIDGAVPQATLAQVLYTCGQASAHDLLLWVDDPEPAPLAGGGDEPTGAAGRLEIDEAGTVGALVEAMDTRAGEGNPCTTLALTTDEVTPTPATGAATGATRALAAKDTVAVLPLYIPQVRAAVAPGSADPSGPLGALLAMPPPDTVTLVTGHVCPATTAVIAIERPEGLLDLRLDEDPLVGGLGSLSLDVEEVELSVVPEDSVELSATPAP